MIKGVYGYTDRREPEKRPYEHINHSDETLVDSNHESTKSHEARSVSYVRPKCPADLTSRRFVIPRIVPFNLRLQLQAPTRPTPSNSTRLRRLPRHLLAIVTGQRRCTDNQRVGLSSSRVAHHLMRKRRPHSPFCLRMFWVPPSGSSRYRKLSSRFSNACNFLDRCITYLSILVICHSCCRGRSHSNIMFFSRVVIDDAGHFISTWARVLDPTTSAGH